MKIEKFLLDIETKCGDIANEILNAAIDAERTFKCKWPYLQFHFRTSFILFSFCDIISYSEIFPLFYLSFYEYNHEIKYIKVPYCHIVSIRYNELLQSL